MIGAILGDIIGSPYEFDRGDKTKDFPLFSAQSNFTDDTVMTIAVCEAVMGLSAHADRDQKRRAIVLSLLHWGKKYPHAGYGIRFSKWLRGKDLEPYNSCGNGSAMRVSSIGWLYDSLEETREMARLSAEVTHNHPEGLRGAEAVASAIYLARTGKSKQEIRSFITEEIGYDLSRTCDEIRPGYHHVETCQESVPEAITAFLEGNSFEDVIRTTISLGGDTDTTACIAGGIAEAFYGVPEDLIAACRAKLPREMLSVLDQFEVSRRAKQTPTGSLSIVQRDLCQEIADCVVNSTNESLSGKSGLDQALQKAAGPHMSQDLQKLTPCPVGEVRITKGYALPAKYVIHAVGPVYRGLEQDAEELARCYDSALRICARRGLKSIAFPLISTGSKGYPVEAAAAVAISSISWFFQEHPDCKISVTLCCHDQKSADICRQALEHSRDRS